MEYYSEIKSNQLLLHAITCMNLYKIMLSSRSQNLLDDLIYIKLYKRQT